MNHKTYNIHPDDRRAWQDAIPQPPLPPRIYPPRPNSYQLLSARIFGAEIKLTAHRNPLRLTLSVLIK